MLAGCPAVKVADRVEEKQNAPPLKEKKNRRAQCDLAMSPLKCPQI